MLLYGRGNRIVHANPAFIAEFGAGCVGLPATEALPEWPRRVFDVIGRVLEHGRALATWVEIGGRRRRLTVAPRRDPESDEIYGVALRLASETDAGRTPGAEPHDRAGFPATWKGPAVGRGLPRFG